MKRPRDNSSFQTKPLVRQTRAGGLKGTSTAFPSSALRGLEETWFGGWFWADTSRRLLGKIRSCLFLGFLGKGQRVPGDSAGRSEWRFIGRKPRIWIRGAGHFLRLSLDSRVSAPGLEE